MHNVLQEVKEMIKAQKLQAKEVQDLHEKLDKNTATEDDKVRYHELKMKQLYDAVNVKGKYKLGTRTELKDHNKNGKVAYTTTLSKENYHWLKEYSAHTGKSGSAILNEFLDGMREEYENNE